ncbi:LysR substrate-binding domain-containing protein [Brevundimonas sp.]|uniref:LysR substrate-binding domain-containing protein n=1 Tax=Brevundimonas sp. TaxID=1871086 RepID=UPI002D6B1F97|nr:LysR substrate-binding domain-containing protein [Brevundimonas sp.]HYC67447.1 LysR substrate-binding domain-containing protein [Brevundimonas sp.]
MKPSVPPLPLKALQAFEATMRLGGMGRAAERLGVTHGAVSRQIGLLQQALGHPLFEGPRNARRPTAEAERLWGEIAPAFAALEQAVAGRTRAGRRVRVSCLSTLAARWLIPRLPDFAVAHPGVVVELTESYAALDRTLGGADLAIRMLASDTACPEGLEAVPFMDNSIGMVVAPGGAPDVRLLSRSHPSAWTDWTALTGRSAPAGGPIEFDHQQTMIEAALAGLGAAVSQRPLIEADVAAGRLVAPHGFVGDGAAFAAFHRRGEAAAPMRRLLLWLQAQGRA